MAKKQYYPNNWQEYKDADESMFDTHTFEEIMSWKVGGWELPSSVCCIIRSRDLKTGKVKEYPPYQQRSAAQRKVDSLLSNANLEVTICHPGAIETYSTVFKNNDQN